ncbi:MAG: AAA family ATPase, partial [Clostridia bacterium]|nr:AAA family ATPase [Clostridia bacterium]
MYQPLADKIRPTELDDVIGQTHIIGENGILRRIIESGAIPNMIFYGPSGIGKTTLAQIIAGKTKRRLYKLNATTASVNDIKAIVSELDTLLAPNGILLYLDEIQYFNKKQQQSLLEFIESGKITLIASTTENPYFYVYNAILSRSTVFEFKPITPKEVEKAIRRAFIICARDNKKKIILEEGVVEHISFACGGDVRKSINAVELLCSAGSHNDEINVTLEDTKIVTQKSSARYDRDGDAHYDILSAFHKSLRGSDVNASLHYLARLLCGGDIASAARRMLCVA